MLGEWEKRRGVSDKRQNILNKLWKSTLTAVINTKCFCSFSTPSTSSVDYSRFTLSSHCCVCSVSTILLTSALLCIVLHDSNKDFFTSLFLSLVFFCFSPPSFVSCLPFVSISPFSVGSAHFFVVCFYIVAEMRCGDDIAWSIRYDTIEEFMKNLWNATWDDFSVDGKSLLIYFSHSFFHFDNYLVMLKPHVTSSNSRKIVCRYINLNVCIYESGVWAIEGEGVKWGLIL